jgi:hypothetical protein
MSKVTILFVSFDLNSASYFIRLDFSVASSSSEVTASTSSTSSVLDSSVDFFESFSTVDEID